MIADANSAPTSYNLTKFRADFASDAYCHFTRSV